MNVLKKVLLVGVCALAAPGVVAQSYYYPSRGQDASLQSKDHAECGSWATQQTGFVPGAPPPAQAPQGGALRGAGRGAAIGAVGGAIGGDAGKGAAIGAATGGLIGGIRRRDQERSAASQQQAGATAYNHAVAACMQGRGYSVN
ncbi:MAG TPA: glycine zipper family protein [Xanthobacteraceae bacterium]|jgi:hypothetical protein